MEKKYAVGLTTVSTLKQQVAGNSPKVQKTEIEHFASSRGFTIVKIFPYTISRSREDESIIKAIIEYCKNSKYPIKYLIFKCIDRFSRGGTFFYLHLKKELAKHGIECIDVYGVIQSPINTLEHLDVEFPWSKVSPSENAEILEANRAKQEVTTILTRMIGSEIGYRRLGYAVRPPKLGLQHAKKVTPNDGIRTILEPDPQRYKWIVRIFKLRAEGVKSDEEIVDAVNAMGYKSKDRTKWDKTKPTPIPVGIIKGKPLEVKQLQKMIQYPEYAGIICDKWTKNLPLKAAYFDGLVSIDTFNKANRGKKFIKENSDGNIEILENVKPQVRNKNNPDYPYKEAISCPKCGGNLRGSASKSKSGRYISYYHCNNGHKYWGENSERFHTNVFEFIRNLEFNKDFIRLFTETVLEVWRKKQKESEQLAIDYGKQVQLLREERQSIKERMKLVSTQSGMKAIEEALAEVEDKIAIATQARDESEDEDQNIDLLTVYAEYFMEHLEELLIVEDKPEQQKQLFGLAFEQKPTYEEILNGTPKLACVFELNEQYKSSKSLSVTPPGIEPGLRG